jgi:hypothetical protein
MIALTITPAAYEALKVVMTEPIEAASPGTDGLVRVWLDRRFVDLLARMRAAGETYSDAILRLARS